MLSNADTKQIFRLLTASTSAPPCPYIELASGAGIITEARARSEISQLIDDGLSGRTSTFSIASELSIDLRTVERLLPSETELGGWGRLGASTIIKPVEFQKLKLQLGEEISKGVVSTTDFRRRCQVDAELLWRLLPSNGEWAWLGLEKASVYGNGYYEGVKAGVMSRLIGEERPVELSSLDSTAPMAFLRKIIGDLLKAGVIEGNLESDKYVPNTYVRARQAALAEELLADGVIAVETLRKERVSDLEAFVKQHAPDAQLLSSHFVTLDFIFQMQNSVSENVRKDGWSDIKDPEKRLSGEDEKALRHIVLKALPPDMHEVAGAAVSSGLEAELQAKCRTFARERAESAWRRRSKEKPSDTPIKRQELSQLLGSEKSLTPTILSHFTNSLLQYATSQFAERYEEMRQAFVDSAKAVFHHKYHTRFCNHLKGLESIKDPSLRSKLAVDLLQYAKDTGISILGKLEMALLEDPEVNLQPLNDLRAILNQTGVGRPESYLEEVAYALHKLEPDGSMEVTLELKKKGMMEEINSQLQSSKDLSLALLSTLLLLLAVNGVGVIKATGKYVPKLLKEVQNAGIATDDQVALMSRVKAAAVGKGDTSAEDMAALRTIGGQCVGVTIAS